MSQASQADCRYKQDQEWLHSPVVTDTTQERVIKARLFAVDRRNFAFDAIKLAQQAERDGNQDRANQLREEARVADAVAMGVESTLSTLFD